MHNHRTPDGRTYWNPDHDNPGEEDAPDAGRTPIRRASLGRPAKIGRGGYGRDELAAGRVFETYERDAPPPIAPRRRIWPALVAVAFGPILVAAVLIKPWGSATSVASPSAKPAATVQTIAGPTASSDLASGSGYLPGGTDPSAGIGGHIYKSQDWSAMDWAFLVQDDSHAQWGFTTVSVQGVKMAPNDPAPTPQITWSPTGTTVPEASADVPDASRLLAIAVTWPANVKVTDVTFAFLGGPGYPAYLPPPGFDYDVPVRATPASEIAGPSPAAQVPQTLRLAQTTISGPVVGIYATEPFQDIGTAIELAAPASRPAMIVLAAQPNSRTYLTSGQFWIAPRAMSGLARSIAIGTAWRTLPWEWPVGTYQVTVAHDGTVTTLYLILNGVNYVGQPQL
jgi:hypothetical protein